MENHRAGRGGGITARYRVSRPVYFEETSDVHAAVARERELKGWKRDRKMGLVDAFNPVWRDLTPTLLQG